MPPAAHRLGKSRRQAASRRGAGTAKRQPGPRRRFSPRMVAHHSLQNGLRLRNSAAVRVMPTSSGILSLSAASSARARMRLRQSRKMNKIRTRGRTGTPVAAPGGARARPSRVTTGLPRVRALLARSDGEARASRSGTRYRARLMYWLCRMVNSQARRSLLSCHRWILAMARARQSWTRSSAATESCTRARA
jgi:hypothetical protein